MITYLYGLAVMALGIIVIFCGFAVYSESDGVKAPRICHWVFWAAIGTITIPIILMMPMVVGKSLFGE